MLTLYEKNKTQTKQILIKVSHGLTIITVRLSNNEQ